MLVSGFFLQYFVQRPSLFREMFRLPGYHYNGQNAKLLKLPRVYLVCPNLDLGSDQAWARPDIQHVHTLYLSVRSIHLTC